MGLVDHYGVCTCGVKQKGTGDNNENNNIEILEHKECVVK